MALKGEKIDPDTVRLFDLETIVEGNLMKITILNGSPKGELSATLQYVYFIQKKYPEIELTIHHVSQKIKAIEKNEKKFWEIVDDVAGADAVWWSVPIYVFLIPAQMKRFIELIWERGAGDRFRDKYAAVLTTSIHFFDHTGNNYMHAVCDDLQMKYVDYYSADMHDLMKDEERDHLLEFAGQFMSAVDRKSPVACVFPPLEIRKFVYQPGPAERQVDAGNKKVLLLADRRGDGTNLEGMIQRFSESFSGGIERINLDEIEIKGGCLGCVKCGFDNECAYEGSDDYVSFYKEKVVPAEIVIYAGCIADRYLSSGWKQFFDRRFFNTHIPTMSDKQIGFIVEGPLGQVPNLREIFKAMVEMDHANLAGIVTDEFGDSAEVDGLLNSLAEKLVTFSERGFQKPETFLGVGGRKIFRDAIWARLKFPFLADFKYYSENGYFDFPQQNENKFSEFNQQMIEALQDPEMKKEIRRSLRAGGTDPLRHIVETR